MSQYIEGPRKTFTAGTALEAFRRVKITAVTGDYGPTVGYAGVSDVGIGVTEEYTASGAPVTIRLSNAPGTKKMMATAAAITGGNAVYAAANGYVASTGTVVEGTALETTAGDSGDLLEVMPLMFAGNVANTAGVGITGTADSYVTSVERVGTIIKTTILIEIDGLNSGGTAADIIGADGAGVAHLGQITAAVNGTIFAGKITCLETPTGGDPDVDLYSATEATGVEDVGIGTLTATQHINHGDWAGGEQGNLTSFPAANKYLYLVAGDATDATYSAGILLIELWGKAA